MDVVGVIKEKVAKSLAKQWSDFEYSSLEVNVPPKPEFGDYTCPIALPLAKILDENPVEIAEKIAAEIKADGVILNISASAPGFVNFFINYPVLAKEVLQCKWDLKASTKQKVSIEHTSVNPNKAAHIGHLRNACLGDTLANLLRTQGHEVEVQNYIDDLGLQVADSVLAFEEYGDAPDERAVDEWFWEIYAKISQRLTEDEELKARRDKILEAMEAGESRVAKELVEKIVERHLETFERFGIKYDKLVYEHDIVNNHLWDNLFESLKDKKLIHKPDNGDHAGAWVVEYGDSEREDKILVRSNGLVTYTGKDLAYALWKFGQGAEMEGYDNRLKPIDMHVNVIDERQSYPQAVIRHILRELGYTKEADNYLHLGYGVVKLSENAVKALGGNTEEDKSTYSMSGRSGIGVMVNDLVDSATAKQTEIGSENAEEIAIGSIRYYMLKSRPVREIVFDFDEALRSDGNTGVYLQYAYARANNILEKAENVAKSYSISELNQYEQALIKTMAEVSLAIDKATKELDPSILCDYTYQLATTFAKFYETSPVLKSDDSTMAFRVALVTSYKELLGKMLSILGIPVLDKI